MISVIAIFAVCLLHGAIGDEDGEARLLASKNILNQYLVEQKDLTVEYKIFNIGGRSIILFLSMQSSVLIFFFF